MDERSQQRTHREDGSFAEGNPWAWKKGQSGNPGGRRKGLSPTEALKYVSEMTSAELSEALKSQDIPLALRLALCEWTEATDLDGKNAPGARQRIYDRCDGPVHKDEQDTIIEPPKREIVKTEVTTTTTEIKEDHDAD